MQVETSAGTYKLASVDIFILVTWNPTMTTSSLNPGPELTAVGSSWLSLPKSANQKNIHYVVTHKILYLGILHIQDLFN